MILAIGRTVTTGAELETVPRGTPALPPEASEGAPTSPAGVNVRATPGRRPAAGSPTLGGPTSPAGRTSPAGVSRTGAPACWQALPTSAVTWSPWWRRWPPPGRTRGPDHAAAGEGHLETAGQGIRRNPGSRPRIGTRLWCVLWGRLSPS